MVIVVRYCGATLLRSLMKKTKGAPIADVPHEEEEEGRQFQASPSTVTNQEDLGQFVQPRLTVEAIARAKVAIKSRLVVFENLSVIMFLNTPWSQLCL